MAVLQQIRPHEIIRGMLPMCQNTTMRVSGAWIQRYCVLCSKRYNTLHSCHNSLAGSRQAARGARICETSLLKQLHAVLSLWDQPIVNSPPPPPPPWTKWPPFRIRHIDMHVNKCILIRISLRFVPKGPIDNKPALVQVLTWYRTGDKPLPEPMLTQFTDVYMRQ